MEAIFDWTKVPESQRVAIAGALFSIAAADGEIKQQELGEVFDSTSMEGLSAKAKVKILEYMVQPPNLAEVLEKIAGAGVEIRCGAMLQMCAVALIDDTLADSERQALENSARMLTVTPEQLEALLDFAREYHMVRVRGIDDSRAAEELKKAAERLEATGIPKSVLHIAGTALVLQAAGLAGAIGAVGLGLVIPGIGLIVAAGISLALLFRKRSAKKKEEEQRLQRERQMQMVIKNMQESMEKLRDQIEQLRKEKAKQDAKLRQYEQKYRELQELIRQRKTAVQLV